MNRTSRGPANKNREWETICARASLSSSKYALFAADSQASLKQLPGKSIDTCLTSPPYWGARDYEHPEQIGMESELDDYITRLVDIFREVRRVLVDSGTVWLNL